MTGSLYIIVACLLWSLDALIRYPLIHKIGSWSIVQSEHLILTLIFLPILIKSGKRLLNASLSHHVLFFLLGFGGSALGSVCFTEAFIYLNPSVVILLQKYQTFITIILAKAFLKERVRGPFLFWAFISVGGAIGLSFPELLDAFQSGELNSGLFSGRSLKGFLFATLAVVCWGSATVIGKHLSMAGFKGKEIMGMRFFYGLIGLAILNFFFIDLLGVFSRNVGYFEFLSTSSFEIWQKLILMVLLSGLLAMGFYYAGLRRISARACSLMELFFPLCAIVVNWVYLGKQLDISQIIGGALLILGVTVVQTKHY
jgi:drug/metabolite transporter (DMT)-like permease